jgi:hypothetical protein
MALSFIIEPPNYYKKPRYLMRLRKILVNLVGAVILFVLLKGSLFIIPLLGGVPIARALLSAFSAFKEQHSIRLSLLVLILHPIWSLINGVATLVGMPWFYLKA